MPGSQAAQKWCLGSSTSGSLHYTSNLASTLGGPKLNDLASRSRRHRRWRIQPIRLTPRHPLTPETKRKPPKIEPTAKKKKEYLKQSSSTAGRRSENIVRTVPVPWCQSGGSDTYRKHPSRKELHDAMNSEHAKAKREFARCVRAQAVCRDRGREGTEGWAICYR